MQLAGTLHGSRHSCPRKRNRNSYGHCTQIPFWPDEVTSMPWLSTLSDATCVIWRQKASVGKLFNASLSFNASFRQVRFLIEFVKFLFSPSIVPSDPICVKVHI